VWGNQPRTASAAVKITVVSTEVRVDVDDAGVAVITLDGPERLNAFSAETGAALGEAYRILMGGPDAAEGAAAWRERRSPRWTSRASAIGDPA
jgi:1,4-dihydroxy-2-naphthoyl-CoA synthase